MSSVSDSNSIVSGDIRGGAKSSFEGNPAKVMVFDPATLASFVPKDRGDSLRKRLYKDIIQLVKFGSLFVNSSAHILDMNPGYLKFGLAKTPPILPYVLHPCSTKEGYRKHLTYDTIIKALREGTLAYLKRYPQVYKERCARLAPIIEQLRGTQPLAYTQIEPSYLLHQMPKIDGLNDEEPVTINRSAQIELTPSGEQEPIFEDEDQESDFNPD